MDAFEAPFDFVYVALVENGGLEGGGENMLNLPPIGHQPCYVSEKSGPIVQFNTAKNHTTLWRAVTGPGISDKKNSQSGIQILIGHNTHTPKLISCSGENFSLLDHALPLIENQVHPGAIQAPSIEGVLFIGDL